MRQTGRLAALLLATALFRASQNMALTTLSLLGHDILHLRTRAIGGLAALAGLTLAASTVFVGGRVPLRSAARAAALGVVLLAGALAAFAASSSLLALAGATVLLGLGGGVALPGLVNAVEHAAGTSRDRIIALYAVVLSVSLTLGPLGESAVLAATHQDVRAPYLAFLALPLLAAALLWVARPSADPPPALADDDGAALLAGGPAASPPSPQRPPRRRSPRRRSPQRQARRRPALTLQGRDGPLRSGRGRRPSHQGPLAALVATRAGRQALLIQLLYAVPFAGLTSFGALIARIGYSTTAADAQLAFTVFFATSLLTRVAMAVCSPIGNKGRLLWVSVALTLAGIAPLGLGHGLALLLVAMAVLGVPHGTTYPLALALVAGSTPTEQLHRANATLLGTVSFATVLVPPVLGAVVPVVGYRGMALLLGAPVVVFAAMLFTERSRVA